MTSKIRFPLVFTLLVLIINSNVDATSIANAAGANGGVAPPTGGGGAAGIFDITKFGTKPNGDATEGIMAAWKGACTATGPSEVLVPAGDYTLSPVTLEGPCHSKTTVTVNGNFKAPSAVKFAKADTWLRFRNVMGLTLQGGKDGGVFDGQGPVDWSKNDCKQNKRCSILPFNFRFDSVNESTITGITSKDSKAYHMNLIRCNQVEIKQVTIIAPDESPSTNGIYVVHSDGITITNSKIGTGTDCISVGDGTKNLLVEKVTCGPGDGIGIGSIGGEPNEAPIFGVTIRSCNFIGTENGIRIKTWLDSYENMVTNIVVEDITLDKVWFPIIVDEEFCPYNHCKAKPPSKVKLNDIKIRNVKGTNTRTEAIILTCSPTAPCEKVELSDIDIKYVGPVSGKAEFVCRNVKPVTKGIMNPPSCNTQTVPNAVGV